MTTPDAAPAKKPAPPKGLGPAGREQWRRLVKKYDFEPHELAAVEQACAALDDVRRLEELLAEQGAVVEGSTGQLKLSPVVGQLRASRLAASRLVRALELPVGDESSGEALLPAQLRGKRAAEARWAREARWNGAVS